VTGNLEVRFVKPVPIERPLSATARVTGRAGSRWFVEAELRLASSDALLAVGRGVLVERDPAHFARHQEWMREQG
jgi:acyl-coenzyme A thioesterase PaaI-like protein